AATSRKLLDFESAVSGDLEQQLLKFAALEVAGEQLGDLRASHAALPRCQQCAHEPIKLRVLSRTEHVLRRGHGVARQGGGGSQVRLADPLATVQDGMQASDAEAVGRRAASELRPRLVVVVGLAELVVQLIRPQRYGLVIEPNAGDALASLQRVPKSCRLLVDGLVIDAARNGELFGALDVDRQEPIEGAAAHLAAGHL